MGTQINTRKIRSAVNLLTQESGKPPSNDEVAEFTNLPLVTVERLRDAKQLNITSLNAPLDEETPEGIQHIDSVTDETFPSPAEEMIRVEDVEQLLRLIGTLSEREQKVICLRFGIAGFPVKTLEQVGKELNCTNERVRQIQNLALKKLHNRMVKLK
jgi:RNA polymerase primary sigma factor